MFWFGWYALSHTPSLRPGAGVNPLKPEESEESIFTMTSQGLLPKEGRRGIRLALQLVSTALGNTWGPRIGNSTSSKVIGKEVFPLKSQYKEPFFFPNEKSMKVSGNFWVLLPNLSRTICVTLPSNSLSIGVLKCEMTNYTKIISIFLSNSVSWHFQQGKLDVAASQCLWTIDVPIIIRGK